MWMTSRHEQDSRICISMGEGGLIDSHQTDVSLVHDMSHHIVHSMM